MSSLHTLHSSSELLSSQCQQEVLLTLVISLEGGDEDGAFLVRESNTAVGDYVLSVLHEGEVVHYQIRRHGEDAFFSIGKFHFTKFCMCEIIF